ncbi:L,D-transpeptidase [Bacillus sp. V59.32b]|uniref:L,D-transpeptidase n=1 Tax=Bacillus sp. V59.32b TaxID=1758642 RepID=UPI00265CFC89|nr:L,D-transpeptidase [Bacillus sp. V59.32b]
MKKIFLCAVLICFMFVGVKPAFAAGSQFIIINKSNNQLAYYENSKLSKVFRVATGKKLHIRLKENSRLSTRSSIALTTRKKSPGEARIIL